MVGQIEPLTAKRGASVTQKTPLHLKAGFHCNSNAPADEYLIPLKLTWAAGPLEVQQVDYPKPQSEHYAFSEKPVSVYSGSFTIETRFRTPPGVKPGPVTLIGKLRYQACNERECLPPKTIEVQAPVDIQ